MMKSILKSFVLLLGALLVPTTVYAQGIHGDVNGDCEVNIADVNAVIDVILGDRTNPAADVNTDGEINIADVNVIINIILEGDEEPVHEYVDLGLPSGTLWATCNVGANSPEEYGDYFAWGEIEPKDFYDWSNYKWCNGSKYSLTKYCTDSSHGTIDGKTELDFEDDAAWVNWGPSWRTPSYEQQIELHTYCDGEKTTINGVNGFLLKGPNGNTIFFPTAGQFYHILSSPDDGAYWSRTLSSISTVSAPYLYFFEGWSTNQSTSRYIGFSVRAVRVSPAGSQGIDIEQQSLDLGGLTIGKTSTGRLTIINNSMQTVTLTATADEPFSFIGQEGSVKSMSVVVPSQSVIPVTVKFTATAAGQFNGNVTFMGTELDSGQTVVPVHAFAIDDDYLQQEYVDLGLPSGTLWATRNVGASTPMDFGSFFAWGETQPKSSYDNSSYQCTKYNNEDNKTVLDPEDDAAFMNWGPSWRMPSLEQIKELCDSCSGQWTSINGINGWLVTGRNGNIMFMPAAGYRSGPSLISGSWEGNYWSRTVKNRSEAFCMELASRDLFINSLFRQQGYSVRAVRATLGDVHIEQQSLDLGIVNVGNTITGELTIINCSNEPITLTATTGEPFSFKQQDGTALSSMTVEVPSNYYTQVTVMFTATSPGEFNGEVTVQHPALDGGQSVISVHARAYADPEQDYVDLGLPSGTLWAARNIGANTPEESGNYFSWGETEPKEEYYMDGYKWYNYDEELYTKYCTNSEYGMVDNKTELDPDDDAAWVNWGPSWRMPSEEQIKELMDRCSWEFITRNGVNGYLVTGHNGNAIFLPAAGNSFTEPNTQGDYWSRTLNFSSEPPSKATTLSINSWFFALDGVMRGWGCPVRAVRMSLNDLYIEQQRLDLGIADMGNTCTGEVTIINCSDEVMTLPATADAPFSFKLDDGSASSMTVEVPGKSYTQVTVMFTATDPGQFNGNVTFLHPALDGGQRTIPVQALAFADVNPQQDAVDLGLPSGTLWATCNVGASSPEESGDRFAWGETEPQGDYDWFDPWSNYKWCDGSENTLTKYCNDSTYGTVDNLTELEPQDDAAWVNWGPKWRMPSAEQFKELQENCSWRWATKNGVKGRLVTGPNGNYIFLPAEVRDDYWSRTLKPDHPLFALCGGFYPENALGWFVWVYRTHGCCIRAVSMPQD